MQYPEVSGAVRPLKWPLGVKWLTGHFSEGNEDINIKPLSQPRIEPLTTKC